MLLFFVTDEIVINDFYRNLFTLDNRLYTGGVTRNNVLRFFMTYLKIIQTYFIVDGNIVLEVLSSVKKNVEFIPKSVTTLIQRQ